MKKRSMISMTDDDDEIDESDFRLLRLSPGLIALIVDVVLVVDKCFAAASEFFHPAGDRRR
jgi:hypothetical protein